MDIIRCPSCGRGVSASESVCPFCNTELPAEKPPWFQIGFTVAVVMITVVVLSLAYVGWRLVRPGGW